MTGQIILEALREGQKTTEDLMAAAGVSRNAVFCALYGLCGAGYQVVNAQPRGGHSGGLYRLVHDVDVDRPLERSCIWPGCHEHLNRFNAGPYCLYHRKRMAVYVLACFDASLDRTLEGPRHEQLDLLEDARAAACS